MKLCKFAAKKAPHLVNAITTVPLKWTNRSLKWLK